MKNNMAEAPKIKENNIEVEHMKKSLEEVEEYCGF